MNRQADRAQMESDEVAAVSVRSTGDTDMRAKNTSIEDLTTFAPGICFNYAIAEGALHARVAPAGTLRDACALLQQSRSSHTDQPARNTPTDTHTSARGSRRRSLRCTKTATNMTMVARCCVTAKEYCTNDRYEYGRKLAMSHDVTLDLQRWIEWQRNERFLLRDDKNDFGT